MKIIAMIPARMGSKRLKQKNLQKLGGIPLITWAIRRSIEAGVFDEIWVNSEHSIFKKIALEEGVLYHKRPEALANDSATSEQYVYEFIKNHLSEYVVQVHSIAPLLSSDLICDFVEVLKKGEVDVLLSVVNEKIECIFKGKPVNFDFSQKTNSQQLVPVQRITWSITGWRSKTYTEAYESGQCATYSGEIGYFTIDKRSGHIIKTKEDLDLAEKLLLTQDQK